MPSNLCYSFLYWSYIFIQEIQLEIWIPERDCQVGIKTCPDGVTINGHMDIHGLCCHLKPCWCPCATKGHVDAHGLCCQQVSYWGLWSCISQGAKLMSVVQVTTESHADICSLGCCLNPCSCLWAGLLLETIGIHGLYYHQRPCRGPWYVLTPEARWVFIVHAVPGYPVEVHDPCSCWL